MTVETISTAVLASIGYAVLFYIKSELPDLGSFPLEQMLSELIKRFNVGKFVSTIIIGGVVGVLISLRGGTVLQETFEVQFSIYAVYIITVENILKTIWRLIKNR